MSAAMQSKSSEATETRIIVRVTESKNGQRRVTIPKEDDSLRKGDWVEIKKLELK